MNRSEILQAAGQCVSVDRNATHGEPEDNFAAIAELQTAYLSRLKRPDGLLPHDVAVLNILQKVARLITSPEHPDHWVDLAGYAACGGECRPTKQNT